MTRHDHPHPAPSRAACMFAGGSPAAQDGVTAWGRSAVGSAPCGRERKLLRTCKRRSGGAVQKSASQQKEKPVHLVQRRNARERRRVQAVNVAFSRLSKVVPMETRGKRISKVKTLHKAIEYIDQLRQLLAADDVTRGLIRRDAGDKENSWANPAQVYTEGCYPVHNYSMQYTIMANYGPEMK